MKKKSPTPPKSPDAANEPTAPVPIYKIEDLVEGITPENRHREVDWGRPVGNEIW